MATLMSPWFWRFWRAPVQTAAKPQPPNPRPGPLFINDVAAQRGDVPEFLIQWRATKQQQD